MNNKPVGYFIKRNEIWWEVDADDREDEDIPLYTHPVKEQGNPVAWRSKDPDGYWSIYQAPVEGAEPLYTGFKELTNAEIEEIGKQYLSAHAQFIGAGECHYEGEIEFARAILRKAQENG